MNIKNILYYNEGLEYSVESKYINNKNLGFSNLNNMSALKAYEEVISGYNYIESENSIKYIINYSYFRDPDNARGITDNFEHLFCSHKQKRVDKQTGAINYIYGWSTKEFRERVSPSDPIFSEAGCTLEEYNLCPNISLWVFKLYSLEDSSTVELFFHYENTDLLQTVADYYNLPNPSNPTINQDILDNPRNYKSFSAFNPITGEKENIQVASIVFKNNEAILFKLLKLNHRD